VTATPPAHDDQTAPVARFVVKLADDTYVVWSDTVDAPVTRILTRSATEAHLRGVEGLSEEDAAARLGIADQDGTSSPTYSLQDLLRTNGRGLVKAGSRSMSYSSSTNDAVVLLGSTEPRTKSRQESEACRLKKP